MITHAIQKLYLIYPRYPEGGYHPPSLSSLTYFFVKFSLKVTIRHPLGECEATFSYLLMCFVPQFTEATYIITLKSVIFPMRFCVYIKNSKFRLAITYFTFKYTILLNKQC